ncbi:hypothetical protein [Haloferula sp. BvORR071]|uniref:hypothetical protein n=1 Tax=Haloferula sp. BvORR071 TaxID=1396141 RepID=UPI00054F40C5|nr:hypothetical protein [Haloferula sp. BvORR071]
MSELSSPPATPPTLSAAQPPAPPRRRGCLVPTLIGFIVLLLVIIGLFFWFNRPIHPVQLNAQEKVTVQQKVEAIQNPDVERVPASTGPNANANGNTLPKAQPQAEPKYEKGSREIILTERELNGLLNEQSLGDKWKIELATDALHLRLETDLPADLPIVGGRHLKARSRFLIKTDDHGAHLVLDDLTVWGVSLPNDWLGQLKGKDLLGEVLGGGKGGRVAGIEEMKVEPGQLKIRLKE